MDIAATEPRTSMSGRDDDARSPRTPIAQTFMAGRNSVDDRRGRERSVGGSRSRTRQFVDDYDNGTTRTNTTNTIGGTRSIPRKSIERSTINTDEPTRTTYSGSSPMSPAVGSVVIPPRKAINRDSPRDPTEVSPISPTQTILDDSNHASRTSPRIKLTRHKTHDHCKRLTNSHIGIKLCKI